MKDLFTVEGDEARERLGLAQMLIDHAGIIRLANSRAEQLFGYECGELAGCSVENLLPARTRERHRQQRDEFVQQQQVRQMGGTLVVHGVRKTGEEIPLEIGLSPIQTDSGTVTLATIIDVSERQRAEEAHRLFLVATSHDVRNTLANVLGYVNLLCDLVTDEASRKYLNRIFLLMQDLSTVMSDMVVHAGVSDRTAVRRPVDVHRVLSDCAAGVEPQCEAMGLQLQVSLPASISMMTDPMLLGRIVQNLLVNAVRYTKEGEIELCAALNANELRISVRDTGIGIPAESLPRIFDQYYRDPEACRMVPLGTGLGLSTVMRFCELLGGSVSVRSIQGVGTTFEVTVPVVTP
jgi:PAS domain S-box-containing protein